MPRAYDQVCPIARTLDIVGDRWTMLIIRDLFFGATKFGEFLERSPGIPPKVLSSRLKRLMEKGLIERAIYSEHPLRAQYRLTALGETLRPVMVAVGAWGLEHLFDGEPDLREAVVNAVSGAIPEIRAAVAKPSP
jgi:DNA-binding HxlR family transcriptional regulator